MPLATDMADRVLAEISERDVADLALHLASIESPAGYEGEVGTAIEAWLADEGLRPRRVGMFEDRFNVVTEITGDRGSALAFNSHMDTWVNREDHLTWRNPQDADYHLGREQDDCLIGNPVANDKGPMAAVMIAARAIVRARVPLSRSIQLAMVAGEIGQEPVDEFQGKRYVSAEVGTRYVLNHAPRPAFCVCAEATNFRKGWVEAGKALYKLTVFGGPALYTPYVERPYTEADQPNAILRAMPLLERIEAWALDYERAHRYDCPGGTVVPRVNVGAIRAGHPWNIEQTPEVCVIYVDVRLAPGQDGGPVGDELRTMLASLKLDGEVEQFASRSGYEARGIEPLVDALDEAHRHEFGSDCEVAASPECSMWRDHNLYNEVGIPALTYGTRGIAGTSQFTVRKSDLYRSARVYALTALAFCGRAQ
jgi:acetylornithine deacetylase/succinyl-diaminopimelate desuccinylase-like protein